MHLHKNKLQLCSFSLKNLPSSNKTVSVSLTNVVVIHKGHTDLQTDIEQELEKEIGFIVDYITIYQHPGNKDIYY